MLRRAAAPGPTRGFSAEIFILPSGAQVNFQSPASPDTEVLGTEVLELASISTDFSSISPIHIPPLRLKYAPRKLRNRWPSIADRLDLGAVIDHVEAHNRGGPALPANLATACNNCNARKSALFEADYQRKASSQKVRGTYDEPKDWVGHVRKIRRNLICWRFGFWTSPKEVQPAAVPDSRSRSGMRVNATIVSAGNRRPLS